jgi:hypothetical protein
MADGPTFTPEQVSTLRQYGVIDEQVSALEARLPLIAVWLEAPTAAGDIRDALETVFKALKGAERELSKGLLDLPARSKARTLLDIVAAESGYPFNPDPRGGFIIGLLASLSPALEVVASARERAPPSRLYSATADPKVIQWIWEALSRGWGEGPHVGGIPPIPEHHFPSFTNGFKAIASVVYAACVNVDDDYVPENAIKRFREQNRRARDVHRHWAKSPRTAGTKENE